MRLKLTRQSVEELPYQILPKRLESYVLLEVTPVCPFGRLFICCNLNISY